MRFLRKRNHGCLDLKPKVSEIIREGPKLILRPSDYFVRAHSSVTASYRIWCERVIHIFSQDPSLGEMSKIEILWRIGH